MQATRWLACRVCGLEGYYRCDGIVKPLEFGGLKRNTAEDVRRKHLCNEAYCGKHIIERRDHHYCHKHLNQRPD